MQIRRSELLKQSPFSLSLSSGFFGFFAHLGFVEALEENALTAQALSGSSAGALVAAGLASGYSSKDLKKIFLGITKNDFWDPALGFGYLKGKKFEQLMSRYFVPSFEETKVPLYVSVFNIQKRRTEVVSTGTIAVACRASSAVPVLFHPVRIGQHRYWDGGIRDRAGHKGVSENSLTPVIHYLHADGWMSRLEDRYLYNNLHRQKYFFKTRSPYKMGPDRLDRGAEVIEHFRVQTNKWLEEKI